MIAPEAGLVRKPAMRAARGCAQQLLLPAPAGIRGGTRASEAARPDFHRPSRLRQSPAAGGAVAGRGFSWPPTHPAADEKARAVGGQAEAKHRQAASRAQGLPVPSARQDDRPAEPKPALAKAGVAIHQRRVTKVLRDHGIAISMDGRGRCHDNIVVERLWRTVKHEWVYLRPAANGIEQKRSLGAFFDWYNLRRPHQALGWRTPDEAYLGQSTAATALAA